MVILTLAPSIKKRYAMGTVTLSSKFQISIPKDVREKQGWKAGDKFAFVPRGDGTLAFVRVPTLEELRGIAKGAEASAFRDDYRDQEDRY
jgi:AbrB family looped-hinge helix DNA binding protein